MPYGPGPSPMPPWPQQNPGGAAPASSRLIVALAALAVLSTAALGVAGAAWFRAAPRAEAARVFSQQDQASARASVCAAQRAVTQALKAATNQPEAKEPGNTLLIAVNIRLAEFAGADYLEQQIAAHPAAPSAVTEPASGVVDALRRLAIGQLGDVPRESLQPITAEINTLTEKVEKACTGHT